MQTNVISIKELKQYIHEAIDGYSRWKRNNVTLRGMKEYGRANENYGSFGKGLYTAFLGNKELARQYGKVYFVINAKPKNPKVFQYRNDAEMFTQKLIDKFCKEHGHEYSPAFFEKNTSMDKEMLKLGYDGLIVKGREMVNYTPENIKYFETERQLQRYYDDFVEPYE
jgi:hypothetical protein